MLYKSFAFEDDLIKPITKKPDTDNEYIQSNVSIVKVSRL